MKKVCLFLGVILTSLFLASEVNAQQVRWGFEFRYNGGWGGGYYAPPVYIAPPPTYYAPIPYYNPYVPYPPVYRYPVYYRPYCW